ncbi:hypothetical protein AMECASPLE_035674 [Ameca splendens]|uniref:Uncharacterized protein n=1 Tax=Ameca splendens TaxID=208324 RepID=A0ABV0XWB9_9TELE
MTERLALGGCLWSTAPKKAAVVLALAIKSPEPPSPTQKKIGGTGNLSRSIDVRLEHTTLVKAEEVVTPRGAFSELMLSGKKK